MKKYPEQITDNIPEFFFVWSINTKKIIYLSENNYINNSHLNQNSTWENVRNLIAQEGRMAFDKMFSEINKGNFHQDIDFATINKVKSNYINIKTYPIRDNGKITKVAGHVLDITKRIEKEKKLEGESRKMEDIMHILAHDLRGPLSNIINLAQMQQDMDDLEEIKSFSQVIVRLGNENNRLIASMIELIELESEEFEINASECKLQDYLNSIVSPYFNEFRERNIELKTDFPSTETNVVIDLVKFRLVIQNLLSNAIKFTNSGGEVLIKVLHSEDWVHIVLEDDGIGIPEDKIAKLFQKFSPARRKGLNGEKSTGLGLSITKKIVELHGGSIEVSSIVDDGTQFKISLPNKNKQAKEKAMEL